MKAMILAAGLGTRLRPLTNDRPKALVEVAGKTLLEITLRRLNEFGVRDVIINVHHFADMVCDYLERNANFGMNIAISREDVLLDTGGGLKKAGWFFQADGKEEPFLLHNVDVISTIDLNRMVRAHQESGALATLAVQDRKSSRHLLFDESGQLCGRRKGSEAPIVRTGNETHPLAFSGIHIISTKLLPQITEDGVFSIIDTYLRLAKQGEKITAFPAEEYYWRDLGKPENVAQTEKDVEQQLVRI